MSQHHCDTKLGKSLVRVVLCFDRMLQRFTMEIVRLGADGPIQTDRPLYSSGGDPESANTDIEFFRRKAGSLRVAIPEAMFRAVDQDRLEQVGTYVVHWRADGSSTILVPKQDRPGTSASNQK